MVRLNLAGILCCFCPRRVLLNLFKFDTPHQFDKRLLLLEDGDLLGLAARCNDLAIFNALGRVFWGKISDIIDRPRAMMIMFLAQGMAFMMLVSVKSPLTVFIASAWVGLNFGGNFALFPAITADYFGNKNVGRNYGWMFTAYGIAGIIGPQLAGFFKDSAKGSGSPEIWMTPFIVAGAACLLGSIIMKLTNPPKSNEIADRVFDSQLKVKEA